MGLFYFSPKMWASTGCSEERHEYYSPEGILRFSLLLVHRASHSFIRVSLAHVTKNITTGKIKGAHC